jgi:hypothetical protein
MGAIEHPRGLAGARAAVERAARDMPVFRRPLGIVEGSFAAETETHGGRSDMLTLLTADIVVGGADRIPSEGLIYGMSKRETQAALRIQKAWSVLRVFHPLMGARWLEDEYGGEFEVPCWKDDADADGFNAGAMLRLSEALSGAEESIEFVTDFARKEEEQQAAAGGLKDGEMYFNGQYYEVYDKGVRGVLTAEPIIRALSNSRRLIQERKSLSKLFVFFDEHREEEDDGYGNDDDDTPVVVTARLALVSAHCTTDGVTTSSNWVPDLLHLLNAPGTAMLEDLFLKNASAKMMRARLPPAQEDLYLPVRGSAARQRWFWAIARVMGWCRRGTPTGFVNPLKWKGGVTREQMLHRIWLSTDQAQYFAPWGESDFGEGQRVTREPTTSTGRTMAQLSPEATKELVAIARSVGATVGAACFALIALSMMDLSMEMFGGANAYDHGLRNVQPWVGSFPINARPYIRFPAHASPDSCMLAFSDGLALPFLPPAAGSVEQRLRLLCASATRQLRKVKESKIDAGDSAAESKEDARKRRVAAQLTMAWNYIDTVDRIEQRLPEERWTVGNMAAVAEALTGKPPKPRKATCGVSSLGNLEKVLDGELFLRKRPKGEETENGVPVNTSPRNGKSSSRSGNGAAPKIATAAEPPIDAHFREIRLGVRAREGEFLVLCWGLGGRLHFEASYDAGQIDEVHAERWRLCMERMLG